MVDLGNELTYPSLSILWPTWHGQLWPLSLYKIPSGIGWRGWLDGNRLVG